MKVKIEKVYVVNLDDRMHRWNLFEKLNNPLIHRIPAVDTRKNWFVYEDYGLELVPYGKSTDHYFTQSKGAVGCYLSHYEIWTDILKNNIKWALVLEDDANINCVQKYLENDGEVEVKENADLVQLNDRTQHGELVYYFNGTTSYLTNLKGAKILKDSTHDFSHFNEEIDDVLQWRVDTIGLHDCPHLLRDSIPGKYCWNAKNAIRLAVDKFIGYNGHEKLPENKRINLDFDPKIKIHESNIVSDVTDQNEKYYWEMGCDELEQFELRSDYMWWERRDTDDKKDHTIKHKCEKWCKHHTASIYNKCAWQTYACSGCDECNEFDKLDMDLWRIKKFDNDVSHESINLLVVLKNEELLLPYFIDYYVELGVDNFTFIDNNSSDDSLNYLLDRKDINSQIYFTGSSYRDNNYGLTWVNTILNKQFKNKWCVVVDVDELIMLKQGDDLNTIKSKMKKDNSNVLPCIMIDFYPKNTKSKEYIKGDDFLSYSCFYDKMNEDSVFYEYQLDNQLTIKGGFRHRHTYGSVKPTNDSVCLTKRSFFKNDFYNSHHLSEGMHWLHPNKFKNWMDPGNRKLWGDTNKYIRFFDEITMVGHFKYLKPDIKSVFAERVKLAQDWSGLKDGKDRNSMSVEYKEYLKNFKESFFCNQLTLPYDSTENVYKNTINHISKLINKDILNKKKFIVVISAQRHGTTTFCEKLSKINDSICLFEAFNNTGLFYNPNCNDLKSHLIKKINGSSWVRDKKIVSLKVFPEHSVDISKLLKLNFIDHVIFLKRNLKDSYQSWVSACSTGNWRTSPTIKKIKSDVGYTISPEEIASYENYKNKLTNWFDLTEQLVNESCIPMTELNFDEVIAEDFVVPPEILNFKT